MCQLCSIKELAKRDRWPKPLEHYQADIELLVTSSHDDYEKFKAQGSSASDSVKAADAKAALLDNLHTLVDLLEEVDADRQKWWTSPEKRETRQRLQEEGNQQKLSNLHKINNDVNERVEAMNARLGQFVRWSLGMSGGIWALQNRGKVDAGGIRSNERW
jgi:hypothetical protein